jgi:hypothetical protein
MTKKTTFLAAGLLVAGFVLGFYTFDSTTGNTAGIVPTSIEVFTGTTDKTIVTTGVTTENTNVAPTAVPAVPEKNIVKTLDATE